MLGTYAGPVLAGALLERVQVVNEVAEGGECIAQLLHAIVEQGLLLCCPLVFCHLQ